MPDATLIKTEPGEKYLEKLAAAMLQSGDLRLQPSDGIVIEHQRRGTGVDAHKSRAGTYPIVQRIQVI